MVTFPGYIIKGKKATAKVFIQYVIFCVRKRNKKAHIYLSFFTKKGIKEGCQKTFIYMRWGEDWVKEI